MKKTVRLLIPLLMSVSLFAVPANPEPAVITYEDGRILTVFLRGDEGRSWNETSDGLRVVKNDRGQFEYAEPKGLGKSARSGMLAHDDPYRDASEKDYILTISSYDDLPVTIAQPDIRMSRPTSPAPPSDPFDHTTFPTLGTKKFLLILVEFSDNSFTHIATDFDSLMNGKDYTYNNAIGSVNAYYRATSFEQFDPNFDVVGPVKLPMPMAYYGNNTNGNTQEFVYDAIIAADSLVDYSDYDNDYDGYVDNIYIIYAGYGECFSGADPNTIWPHRSALYTINPEPVLDGKRFWDYSTSMEFYGISGTTRTSVGVICHEFGHVCGLPDFYDTDYEESGGNCGGLGDWDAMAGGSWNDAGRRPPIFNAWSRIHLNWMTAGELTNIQSVTLDPAHSHNTARYFRASASDEFFMMENRQRSGWDAAIPGHGLLIYHIDRDYSNTWDYNSINCNPYHQAFDLEEADGQGNITSSQINGGDPFPGTSGNTQFTDSSTPNAMDWAGSPSRSPIRNIQENAGVITFNFGDANVDPPTDLSVIAHGYDSISVSWSPNAANDSVMIVWSPSAMSGFPENLHRYDIGDAVAGGEVIYKGLDTLFYHTGLMPGSDNRYALYAFDDSAYTYSEKISGTAKTASPAFYATDFSQGLPEGWVLYDRLGNGTFTTENPEGRILSSTTAANGFMLIDSEHAGAENLIDAEMITQSFNFALSRSVVVKFEHRFEKNTVSLARLLYTINNGLVWYEAGRWTENTPDPEVSEIDLSAEIKGFKDVKFKFKYNGINEKYWCVDDFQIFAAQDSGLSAGFHSAIVSGSKPLTVNFMNTTVSVPDTVDSYVWEFGDDGSFYYEKTPIHTYTMSGVYTVNMSAQKGDRTSSCTKTDYITVYNDAPVVISDIDTLDIRKNVPSLVDLNTVFSDPNGDPLTFSWHGNSDDLSISLQDDSIAVLTPGTDYMGIETVTFVAKDNENDSTSLTLDVWISETGIDGAIPKAFAVSQNYPNPFNPVTAISYQLSAQSQVNLTVYDLNGHKVRTLINDRQMPGYYTVGFNAGDLPSGVYLYRLTAGNEVITKKMVLMK